MAGAAGSMVGEMKISLFVVSALFLLLPACGDQANASVTAAENAAKQAAAALEQTQSFAKLRPTLESLGKTLGSITDGATAEKAKSVLEGLLEPLKAQMGGLANLGALSASVGGVKDGLVKAATEQIKQLAANPAITKAVGPVLEKLAAALSGK